MRSVRHGFIAAAALGMACGNGGVDPDPTFSAAEVREEVDFVLTPVDTNPAVTFLTIMGRELAAPSAADPAFGAPGAQRACDAFADLLGRTLVFNTETDAYEIDLAATGAPPNGVRFTTYEVNPAAAAVVIPLVETGFLDLTNESSAGECNLRVRSVMSDVVRLDYTSNSSGNLVVSTLTHEAAGTIAAAGDPITFDIDQAAAEASGSTGSYLMSRGGTQARFTFDFDFTTFVATTTLTVTFDGPTFRITTTGTPRSVSGEITSGGSVVALIGGTSEAPTFEDPQGIPYSGEPLIVFHELFGRAERMVELVDAVLTPSYWVYELESIFGTGS